jgi:hypothetical protein
MGEASTSAVLPKKSELLRLQFHPADRAIVALLLLSNIIGLVARNRPGVPALLATHFALLICYFIYLFVAAKWSGAAWLATAHPLFAMTVIFTLYSACGHLGMAAMPYRADATLSRIDTALCAGVDPAIFLERWQTPTRVEFFAFFYGLFIPYINLSLVLGALGRRPLERDQFLTGWVFTYCISYLGYLFLPSAGPGVLHAGVYAAPLRGGLFYGLVLRGVESTGGLFGAFPSLHAGSSLYLCLFDLKTSRLRGMTYLPIVVLIFGATLILRYHYVIDLIVGTVISASCVHVGRIVFLRWARVRRNAGLMALPEGQGDVLLDLPNDGRGDAAALLSKY